MKASFKDNERNGCSAHGQHNSIQKGLGCCDELETMLEKYRKLAFKHDKSNVFRRSLAHEQKVLDIKVRPLLQDCPTRWGSTKTLLVSILDHPKDKSDGLNFKNREAINKALKVAIKKKDDWKKLALSVEEMIKIRNICTFLTSFDIFTTTLGGNKFVTSSIVLPVIKSIQAHLKVTSEDPHYIKVMKGVILEDYKTRVRDDLNHKSLVIATALDPRFKKLKVLENKDKREDIFKVIELEMKDLQINKLLEVKDVADLE